ARMRFHGAQENEDAGPATRTHDGACASPALAAQGTPTRNAIASADTAIHSAMRHLDRGTRNESIDEVVGMSGLIPEPRSPTASKQCSGSALSAAGGLRKRGRVGGRPVQGSGSLRLGDCDL